MENCYFHISDAHNKLHKSSANFHFQRNVAKEIQGTTRLQTLKKLSKKTQRKIFMQKEKYLADSWARQMGYFAGKDILKRKTYEYMKITKKLLEIYKKYSRKFKKFEIFETVNKVSDEFLQFLPLIDDKFRNSPNNYINRSFPYRKHQTEILDFLIKNYFQSINWHYGRTRTGWFERINKTENSIFTSNRRLKFRKPEEAIYQFLINN